MLDAYLCPDGRLRPLAQPVSAEDLRRAFWIDLLRPSAEETAAVEQATGRHVPGQPEVNEIESSSRLATRDGALYVSLPLLHRETAGLQTVSAGMVLSSERLVTVRFSDSETFNAFVHSSRGAAPQQSAAHIFVALIEAIVDRQADVLEGVRAELDELSGRTFAMGARNGGGRKQEDAALRLTLGRIGQLADLLSHVRDTQIVISRMVPYVQSAARGWLPDALHPRLETLAHDIDSIGSFDNFLGEKLQFMLDATLGFINIAQNNVMKVLTIASVVGIPPVLIAGIYGMNFKNMPELNWTWGYAYSWVLLVLSGLIPLGVFRWNKWI